MHHEDGRMELQLTTRLVKCPFDFSCFGHRYHVYSDEGNSEEMHDRSKRKSGLYGKRMLR